MALSVLALGASALVVTPGAPIQPALRARCPAPQALVEPHDLPAVFNRERADALALAFCEGHATKGARKPNPLREFKLSTSARKFPRNPNPRSPPLPFVVAF